jgi:phosphohistidine swiveling domain-containing protein
MDGREDWLDAIQLHFGGGLLAIRSSALVEDGATSSNAGAFLSKLKIRCADRAELAAAIDGVAASMTGHPRDQVLVQSMASNIALSGVIMTFDLVHGAPYYCIEYEDETGRTDLVTSGAVIHKGLFVYRDADLAQIRSPRIASFLRLARELEALCGCPALDIEFGMGPDGQLTLFQVRRISLAQNWHPATEIRVKRHLGYVEAFVRDCSRRRDGIVGSRTVLAVMPDWNPAEIIGTNPRPLAASLYQKLITSGVWCKARSMMGYRELQDQELMVLISSHPYIDVRLSFNSFLPAGLDDGIGERLVDAWLDRFEAHPELHDKVEFEIVPTCLDFCFDEDFQGRYPGLLNAHDYDAYRNALRALTRGLLKSDDDNTLEQALVRTEKLKRMVLPEIVDGQGNDWIARASYLIGQCREYGTLSFAIVARHAFVAESLLRAAQRCGVLTGERVDALRRSIRTVTGSLVEAYGQTCRGVLSREAFIEEYGHLRPGTYEITSLRYDERDDLFDAESELRLHTAVPEFVLTADERQGIEALMAQSGLDVMDADALIHYAKRAIAGREQVKFLFTRTLSDALSALVRWGQQHGLSRDDLSFVPWPRLADCLVAPTMDHVDKYFLEQAEQGRRSILSAQAFRFSHNIFDVKDLHIATNSRSVPNFVGNGKATGALVELTPGTSANIHIKDRIVCIESADPGFDWIFTKGPSALITKFGGANSHMAIRCAELGIPAAIGCGTQFYERIVAAGQVELDCAQHVLKIIGDV